MQTVRISAEAGVTNETVAVTIVVTIAVTIDELRHFIELSPDIATIRADGVFADAEFPRYLSFVTV